MNLKNIYLRLIALGDIPAASHMLDLQAHIDAPDDQAAMLTAFRHAANAIGVEAGVIAHHISHSESEASVCGDHYFLELISEAELRFRKLSVRYERLRAAAIGVQDNCGDGGRESQQALGQLNKALTNDQ